MHVADPAQAAPGTGYTDVNVDFTVIAVDANNETWLGDLVLSEPAEIIIQLDELSLDPG